MRPRPLIVVVSSLVATVLVGLLLSRTPLPHGGGGLGIPRRIVTPAPSLCECVFAIGAGDRLVGVSRFCDEPEGARALPRVGGIIDPNLQAIADLSPDLVLLQGRIPQLEDLALRRGWRVETFRIESIQDLLSALERLGDVLGAREGAAREVARLRGALEDARRRAPSPSPRALLALNRTPGDLGSIASVGSRTFLSECLAAAGAVNVMDDLPQGYPMVSLDGIVERRPDVVIELRSRSTPDDVRRSLALDWKALPGGAPRVSVIDGSETLVPGPRLASLVARMGRALRGDAGP